MTVSTRVVVLNILVSLEREVMFVSIVVSRVRPLINRREQRASKLPFKIWLQGYI